MRLTAFIMIVAALHVSAKSASQTVTFSGKEVRLKHIFSAVEQQTGYVFFYDGAVLRHTKPVSLDVKDMPLTRFMQQLLQGQALDYSIKNQTIFIRKRPEWLQLDDQNAVPPQTIRGMVRDRNGNPVSGASVRLTPGYARGITNEKGEFALPGVPEGTYRLEITFIGYETLTQTLKITGEAPVQLDPLVLTPLPTALDEISVVSTGYEALPKERATGSFVKIDNKLLNRRVSTNILDRLDGVTSGLIFNKNTTPDDNASNISIRGRSTIFANPNPLIVIDNFPYDGDISNINPNDVESITVLKDAAASSIWGAFSGNGVIVITTKKGKYNQAPKVSFNSNVTVSGKPDLWYQSRMSTSDYIDLERFLYGRGYYNPRLNGLQRAVSPVVELMDKASRNIITQAEADAQIDALRNNDVRSEEEKYLYRNSVKQQYSLNVTGGGANHQYAFSTGYDKNLQNLVNDRMDRITINAGNTFRMLQQKLELRTGVYFSKSKTKQNTGNAGNRMPYFSYTDANGRAAISNHSSEYFREGYLDTAGGGKLLDWFYRPLDEIDLADNETSVLDYRINAGLYYKVINGLDASVTYQYNSSTLEQRQLYSEQTYFARDLINRFSQVNFTTGSVFRPLPLGGILDTRNIAYNGHNIRGQVNYNHTWNKVHAVNAIAGAELKDASTWVSTNRLYGYDSELATTMPVNYLVSYPMYYNPIDQRQIDYRNTQIGNYDRFISYFGNASYTYNNRYIVSLSGRKDASNLFGAKTNQRGVPLWSAGLAWNLHNESFYKVPWLPYLKVRMTKGYNGNIDKSVTAYITSIVSGTNFYGANAASINNPPNPSLRWEKIHMFNTGIDFETRNRILSGSVEFYTKKGTDLLGYSPLAPSTGVPEFKGNTADIKGKGLDVVLNANILNGNVKWQTNVLFSYNRDEVTDYKVKQPLLGYYVVATGLNPLVGRPLYSLFSYRFSGLDPATGDPVGILDGHTSKDYAAFGMSSDFNNMEYSGPVTPPYFGSFRNTVDYKGVSLSFNITYKFGHVFRRQTVDYSSIIDYGYGFSHGDYAKRWQKPGDEAFTDVPSFVYPVPGARDQFYANSTATVERGDHIRLQDIRLSYDLPTHRWMNSIRGAQVYLYADNVGILWRANNRGIDPDYALSYSIPPARSIAAGLKIDF
jgi:TonB-linked SusC/RagA family outer membrane protein